MMVDMPNHTEADGNSAETPRNSAPSDGEPADRSPETDAADAFRSLQPGETVSVHRLSPSYAQGYLDHIVVPNGEELDVMSELKANWGGGRYQLKAKKRAANNRMVFSGINATVVVAGEPTLNGQVYRNGRLVDPEPTHSAPSAPQVVYAQQPSQSSAMDPLNARILGMVESALTNGGQQGSNQPVDMVGLIGALRETLQPQRTPTPDPYKDFERALGLFASIRETFAGDGGSSRNEDSGGGLTGLGAQAEAILLQKIMGGGAPSPQGPPPWQQPTGQWMQGQWGGSAPNMPGGPPMGGPPPGPPHGPPPGPQGWPNQPGPVGWPYPPTPPPAASPPPPPPVQTTPPPPAPAPTPEDDGEDEEPFTVDNLKGELECMTPEQRQQFMASVAHEFGFDELIGKQMFPNGIPQPQTQGESAPPMQDFTGLGLQPPNT